MAFSSAVDNHGCAPGFFHDYDYDYKGDEAVKEVFYYNHEVYWCFDQQRNVFDNFLCFAAPSTIEATKGSSAIIVRLSRAGVRSCSRKKNDIAATVAYRTVPTYPTYL
jgi:hypothetical protein